VCIDLEGLLLRYKALEKPSMELMKESRRGEGEDDEDELDGGEVGMVNTKKSGVRTGGSTRMKDQEDEDSDFDM
jgi:hypothetical protein